MAWWSIFTKTPVLDTAANLAQSAASGIDKIFYTPEEKARASQKFFDTWLEFQRVLQSESSPTAISRRILAFLITSVFLSLIIVGVVFIIVFPAISAAAFQAAKELSLAFEAVVATYFIKDAVIKAINASKS